MQVEFLRKFSHNNDEIYINIVNVPECENNIFANYHLINSLELLRGHCLSSTKGRKNYQYLPSYVPFDDFCNCNDLLICMDCNGSFP